MITRENLLAEIQSIVSTEPVLDIHTHLYDVPFGELLLWGIDELLTYHYLVAEVFRAAPLPYDQFWGMSKSEQADYIWKHLFLERSPVSEACRGVLTALKGLGLDTSCRDLNEYRQFFKATNVSDQVDRVLKAANVSTVVMTNDPFDRLEKPVWESSPTLDPRFKPVLRLDPLLNDWERSSTTLNTWGYKVSGACQEDDRKEIRRFLEDWIIRMKPVYGAVSLPPSFDFPDDSVRTVLIDRCVLPVLKEHELPFAMMIGVRRSVNPRLKLAGDGVGPSTVSVVDHLCLRYPGNKFMVTMLARENQHELCVSTRKFPNLMLFGCWWFLNNPSLIEEITSMRLELLGLTMIPQHSDARILEQLIYKWSHSRTLIAQVLYRKYLDLLDTGWQLTPEEIQRDVRLLFSENFRTFAGM